MPNYEQSTLITGLFFPNKREINARVNQDNKVNKVKLSKSIQI